MTQFKPNHDDSPFSPEQGREALSEVIAMGNAVKVIAIDVETGTEVSIVGSAAMTPYSLKMNAMRKLIAVLSKMEEPEPDHPRQSRLRPGRYA
ncbi:MAG: hypothetical protein EXR11_03865 [Rhodospirillaceae bacterium]|nr:hypothetical protein [Rhodospirillaceae bacterium]